MRAGVHPRHAQLDHPAGHRIGLAVETDAERARLLEDHLHGRADTSQPTLRLTQQRLRRRVRRLQRQHHDQVALGLEPAAQLAQQARAVEQERGAGALAGDADRLAEVGERQHGIPALLTRLSAPVVQLREVARRQQPRVLLIQYLGVGRPGGAPVTGGLETLGGVQARRHLQPLGEGHVNVQLRTVHDVTAWPSGLLARTAAGPSDNAYIESHSQAGRAPGRAASPFIAA